MDFTIIRWLFIILIIIFQTIYSRVGIVFVREHLQRQSWNHSTLPNIINMLMVIFAFGSLFIDILLCLEILKPWAPFNNLFILLSGIILFIGGSVGTLISRYKYLQKSWSSLIKIFPKKKMIHFGPYRCIRHPIYLFSLFFFIGSLFIFPTLLNTLCIVLVCTGYIVLTKMEDDYLQENLDFYKQYAQNVRFRLIPGIW